MRCPPFKSNEKRELDTYKLFARGVQCPVSSAQYIFKYLREPSQFIGPSRKANAEQMENRQAPKDTKLIVRIPAGRSALLLSHPISPPKMADITIRLPKPHSSGVR